MKTFHLVRKEDPTGVSGTGVVAEGIEFADGTCAMRWLTDVTSVAVYNSISDVITIHGHNGATVVEWDAWQGGGAHFDRKVFDLVKSLANVDDHMTHADLDRFVHQARELVGTPL